VDGDVGVPVRPALLVPEAQGVHQLVHDDADRSTILPNVYGLFPAHHSNPTVTPAEHTTNFFEY